MQRHLKTVVFAFMIAPFLLVGCGKGRNDKKLVNSFWSYSELVSLTSFTCQFTAEGTFSCLEGVTTGLTSLNVMGVKGNYSRSEQSIVLTPTATTCPARKDTLVEKFKEAKLINDSTLVVRIGSTSVSMKRTTVDKIISGTSRLGCIYDNRAFERHEWENL